MAQSTLEDAGQSGAGGRTDASEFGGPLGAALFVVGMPAVSLYLWLCIHRHGGALVLPTLSVLRDVPVPTVRGAAYFVGWLAFQAALQIVLPGRRVSGLPGRDGVKLEYTLNGLASFVISLAGLGALYAAGIVRGQTILDELGAMLVIAILISFAFSLFLYFYGLTSNRPERRTGNFAHDFFMGSSLNPRIGNFDLKAFFESKVGLTTWIALALAMAATERERTGHISTAMLLVVGFHFFYVADFYWFEEALFSTWDINHENYGFMLAFAFIVWMPFNFSLQEQYLAYQAVDVSLPAVLGLVILNFTGYYIFRSANFQKHAFRTREDVRIWGKPATFLQTKRGTKLLTSGWWGLARHANYLGDLMMALAWCLPTGFRHVPPYFYVIYFAPLLIDRERRDHRACKEKYGEDWDRYCARVKYRIVPFLY
jgi:delta14-sterol reductase/lamin-B receptor